MFVNIEIKSLLEKLSNEENNKKCFDCGNQPARWVSLNYAIYLCQSCSDEHKKLESNSNIKSITFDQWNKAQLNLMKKGGNQKLNIFLESNNIPKNVDKTTLYNSKIMFYYKKKLQSESEERILLEQLPPQNEILEPYQENNDLDIDNILINKNNNFINNNIINTNEDNSVYSENDNNDFMHKLDYPKNSINIDEEQYSKAKDEIISNNKNDTLLTVDDPKYESIGSDNGKKYSNNSGYISMVGNILYKVWDTGVYATSSVKDKMSEYQLGKNILFLGGKLYEGVAYIGGKLIEKGADIIHSETTQNLLHKAGEGIKYITNKFKGGNRDREENNDYTNVFDGSKERNISSKYNNLDSENDYENFDRKQNLLD